MSTEENKQMAEIKFGFIGTGNMGSAIARAVRRALPGREIMLADTNEAKAHALANELGGRAADGKTVAAEAEYIVLGVKPQVLPEALAQLAPVLSARRDRFVIVTMAAGVPIARYAELLGHNYPVIRIMPNTPVAVGEGVVVFSASDEVFMDEITEFCACMRHAGRVDRIDEKLIDAACALSGCGPAFVYMFADALALAAVECGLSREKAEEYAVQTVTGAAKLMQSGEKHPDKLRDEVCSPAGATIAGVHSLENAAFKGAVMDAVKAAFDKTRGL